jgi:hypothetical protein
LRDSGVLLAYVLRVGEGEPPLVTDARIEDFFFIDKGSVVLGAVDEGTPAAFGVVSLLLVGKKGCRLLRGIAVGMP